MQNSTLVQAFAYGQKPVRTIIVDDEPWFLGNDVADVLGYTNPREAIRKHCKEHGVTKRDIIDSMGRDQSATFINEANLYRLVVRSRKAEAEQFESWVMEDVLPQIRKSGSYRAPLGISDDPILATLGAIVEMRTRQLDMERKVEDVDHRLSAIENEREAVKEAMSALPAPTVEVPDLSMRKQCIEAVNTLVAVSGHAHQECWKMIYARFDLVHGKCLTKRAHNTGLSKMDWIEQNNMIDDLYGLICVMVERAKKAA